MSDSCEMRDARCEFNALRQATLTTAIVDELGFQSIKLVASHFGLRHPMEFKIFTYGSLCTTINRIAASRRIPMIIFHIVLLLFLVTLTNQNAQAAEQHDVLVVVGAAGGDSYGEQFIAWAQTWREASERAKARFHTVGLDKPRIPEDTDKVVLQRAITSAAIKVSGPLWIVLIGHGTYDGRSAKFNLRGPDVATDELAEWLKNYPRPVVLLNTAPASAPFLQAISHPGRVVITATKSGNEGNATRFGGYIAEALGNAQIHMEADLDHDGQVSVLEVFLSAAHAVELSYKKDGLLATEHPLIDDNGDGRGTRADWFQGVWATKTANDKSTVDGIRAHQIHLLPSDNERNMSEADRKGRDLLENDLAVLRAEKKSLSEADYYQRIEIIMIKLAEIYQRSAPLLPQAPTSPPKQTPAAIP